MKMMMIELVVTIKLINNGTGTINFTGKSSIGIQVYALFK